MFGRAVRIGRKRGFTLLEVLVVVAIIALLFSILIPSLSRAKAHARNAVCLANLQQFGVAKACFTVQHANRVPVGHAPDQNNHWVLALAREMGVVKRVLDYMTVNHVRVDQLEYFHCPERTVTGSKPWLGYVSNSLNPRERRKDVVWQETEGLANIDRYKQPASTVYIIDAETEPRVNVPGLYGSTPPKARDTWERALNQGLLEPANRGALISFMLANGGGIDAMAVWQDGHLPEYATSPVDPVNPNRRVAINLHMGRLSNAVFHDGHAAGLAPEKRLPWSENHKLWLRRFGIIQ